MLEIYISYRYACKQSSQTLVRAYIVIKQCRYIMLVFCYFRMKLCQNVEKTMCSILKNKRCKIAKIFCIYYYITTTVKHAI